MKELVKELREKTGAGFMNCKKALEACNGNLEEAVDWLRKKGLNSAASKSSRTAAEGVIALAVNDKGGFAVEINSETDFVAKNEKFRNFAKNILQVFVEDHGSLESLKAKPFPNSEYTVEQEIANTIASIGENIVLRECNSVLGKENSVINIYAHNTVEPNMGKIGVIVELQIDNDKDCIETNKQKLLESAKHIAMHVSAMSPIAIDVDNISQATIAKEKEILRDLERNNGTAEDKIDFLVDKKINGFFKNAALLNQQYIMHNKHSVGGFLKELSKEIGADVKVAQFKRMQLGKNS